MKKKEKKIEFGKKNRLWRQKKEKKIDFGKKQKEKKNRL